VTIVPACANGGAVAMAFSKRRHRAFIVPVCTSTAAHQMMLLLMPTVVAGTVIGRRVKQGVTDMRTTVNLDDALFKRAQRLSGLSERSVVLREALNALIQRESARRLSHLGGSEKQLKQIDRRRTTVK
jgi:Arc/MetJ family transcription regulator